ncbi:alcohol dehydrogenase, putative [Cordyceps militaris CM01]|uniref:Alcohol dehydrogenase, putative n=1 Tax=Cordyceps militaris (strain CM01) TaxID=983644 RepID=G3JS30_CORMM|nr:alcohol dehydrogenase, putative [Cordyceps militaris CM01]EGX88676.1 alcohol dehydrogenase, putative [Cordyceps militaris CM01]
MTSPFTIKCRGIVAYSEHEWVWEELLTREPHEDEFLVEMIATGVCHTDISGYGGIYPRVLGHEGAGRILQLGSGAQREQYVEGDLVILSAAACLDCHYCKTGHPAFCINHAAVTLTANEPNFVLARDPSQVIGGGYFGQSSFVSHAPVKVSCAAKVTKLIRDAEELKMYAPLGCGIMTGAGSITHVGLCKPDDVLAVVGLGGVGQAAVCAAKKLGVKTIVAVDLLDSRIELAKTLGATHSLNSSPEVLRGTGVDMATALRSVTPGTLGCTHVLDTSPSVHVLDQCLQALRKNGTVLQVGLKPVGATLELDVLAHMVNGRRLVGVLEGDRDPAEALPELVSWVKDGTLPMEKLLTHFPAREFVAARAKMEGGEVIKSVLVWD